MCSTQFGDNLLCCSIDAHDVQQFPVVLCSLLCMPCVWRWKPRSPLSPCQLMLLSSYRVTFYLLFISLAQPYAIKSSYRGHFLFALHIGDGICWWLCIRIPDRASRHPSAATICQRSTTSGSLWWMRKMLSPDLGTFTAIQSSAPNGKNSPWIMPLLMVIVWCSSWLGALSSGWDSNLFCCIMIHTYASYQAF